MAERIEIRLQNHEETLSCGRKLAESLYEPAPTILLTGELGAGKTTFLQGFAEGLGIPNRITSPTFALEQQYRTQEWGELLHLDLYRLSPRDAQELVAHSDEHDGLRCIEWADRLARAPGKPRIRIHLAEEDNGRMLSADFEDVRIPGREDVETWRKEMQLPQNIAGHCDAVADFCDMLSAKLLMRGDIVRPRALRRAAEVHDMLRFLDFHPGSAHLNRDITEAQREHWRSVAGKFAGMGHEAGCAAFLRERGYPAIAAIAESHGLRGAEPRTIEQRLLFYADKRVRFTEVVSLEERFRDFRQRYANGKETPQSRQWHRECEALERSLFPEGAP